MSNDKAAATGGPLTKEQREASEQAWKDRWTASREHHGTTFLPAVLEGTPSAWKSIPTAVRFAVWVWAICVIVGVAGFIIGALLWVLVFGAAISQL